MIYLKNKKAKKDRIRYLRHQMEKDYKALKFMPEKRGQSHRK